MFVNTNYRTSGASALVNYIEQDHPLRNSAGRELSDREVRGFIQKSDRHQFEREFQISPDPEANVSQRRLEQQTRRFIGEFLQGRHSVRAVYAYHGSTDIPHTHVAMTGERRDLFVDRDDIAQIRQTLSQRLEQTRTQEQRQRQQQQQQQRQRQEQQQSQRQRQGHRLRVDRELEQVQSQRLTLRPENQRQGQGQYQKQSQSQQE